MRTASIVVENFYSDPDAVVRYASSLQYYKPYPFPGSRWLASQYRSPADCPFKSATIIEALESITGEEIDREHWNAGYPCDANSALLPGWKEMNPRSCRWNTSFHVKLAGTGDGVHNHVTDAWNGVGTDGWAGIVYLNRLAPLEGGLKIWEPVEPAKRYDWMTEKANWKLIDTFANVFNRILLCRGNLPHSGAAGWGADLQSGRLFQTFFFKCKARKPGSVSLKLEVASK
jgi:hypothetical protein